MGHIPHCLGFRFFYSFKAMVTRDMGLANEWNLLIISVGLFRLWLRSIRLRTLVNSKKYVPPLKNPCFK